MRGLLFICSFLTTLGFAQTKDAELWLGASTTADLKNNFSIKLETQTRFYKNASTLKTYYNELAVDYKINKQFDIGLSYRYSRKNRADYYSGENRFCLNATYGSKLQETGLRFKARARYQFAFDRLSVINDAIYPSIANTFRLKTDLKYKYKDFKRVQPYLGYELFKSPITDSKRALDAYRLYLGFHFDLPAKHSLKLKYIFEQENGSKISQSHIYILQYNYLLPKSLFRKK